jgi:hypothetical protein
MGSLNRLSGKRWHGDTLPQELKEKFLFLWTTKEGDNLMNLLGTDQVTITGKDFATSYIPEDTVATFAVPDNATYLAADGADDFWFNSSGVLQQKTLTNLISASPQRTFFKYADFAPFNGYALGILKAGEVLSESDKISLNRYFKLWAYYWGVLMDSGYTKDNRIENE